MENIINKLNKIEDEHPFCDWNLEEIQKLLNIYLIFSKKENHIFDLIYGYHGCDSWEDIFRDYDMTYLKDKERGVKIAIDEINEEINEEINNKKNEQENEEEIMKNIKN